MMKKVSTAQGIVKQGSGPISNLEEIMRSFDPDTRLTIIQSLIPLGLAAVCDALQEEVQALCGARYALKGKQLAQPALGPSAKLGVSGRSENGGPGSPGARHADAKQSGVLHLSAVPATCQLDEGLEETLTLHGLGMAPFLRQSFRTTNCIESINSQVACLTRNVRRWTTASQRHRWLATCLMDIEPRLRAVKGYRYSPMLTGVIQRELAIVPEIMTA